MTKTNDLHTTTWLISYLCNKAQSMKNGSYWQLYTNILRWEREERKENKMGWRIVYIGNKGFGLRHGSMEQWVWTSVNGCERRYNLGRTYPEERHRLPMCHCNSNNWIWRVLSRIRKIRRSIRLGIVQYRDRHRRARSMIDRHRPVLYCQSRIQGLQQNQPAGDHLDLWPLELT